MEVQHKIVMSQVMLPHQANVAGNVHGGEIMKFMDMAAAAVAMKFSKGNCVTARVDELLFHLPIFVGALVTCTASLVYVGRTSMEVLVRVESEDTAVRKRHCPPTSQWSAWVKTDALRQSEEITFLKPNLKKSSGKKRKNVAKSSSRERQRKKLQPSVNRPVTVLKNALNICNS